MHFQERIVKELYKKYVKYVEGVLAIMVLVALVIFAFQSSLGFFSQDWQLVNTFYEFISTVLLILVGLELIRLMVFHSFTTVLELMILIIARKMLSPDIDATNILLGVIAMAVVMAMNYVYAIKPIKSLEDLSQ